MARTNGKSDIKPEQLDVEHELPAAQDGAEETQGAQQTAAIPKELTNLRGDIEKLRSERDTLVDRLARLQAEFENARKRAAKEQQDFKDFALADAIKRAMYDRFGHAGVSGGGGGFAGGFDASIFQDFSDIFGDFFGLGDL